MVAEPKVNPSPVSQGSQQDCVGLSTCVSSGNRMDMSVSYSAKSWLVLPAQVYFSLRLILTIVGIYTKSRERSEAKLKSTDSADSGGSCSKQSPYLEVGWWGTSTTHLISPTWMAKWTTPMASWLSGPPKPQAGTLPVFPPGSRFK